MCIQAQHVAQTVWHEHSRDIRSEHVINVAPVTHTTPAIHGQQWCVAWSARTVRYALNQSGRCQAREYDAVRKSVHVRPADSLLELALHSPRRSWSSHAFR